jgi:G3E family GTPase
MTKIINTKKFDFEMAQDSEAWARELLKPAHTPETEEYGIKSWIYRSNRPFHPKRFYDFMLENESNPKSVFNSCIRAKGTVWLASRHFNSFQY